MQQGYAAPKQTLHLSRFRLTLELVLTVPTELHLMERDKVSSCKPSRIPSTTSSIVGRSRPTFSVQRRASSATFHTELISQSPLILGSVTLSISPSESQFCAQSVMLFLSESLMVMIAGWPVMSTRRTTPKLYTSLFSLR